MNSIKYPALEIKIFPRRTKKLTGNLSLEWSMTSLGYVEIQWVYTNIVFSKELPTNF